MSGKFPLLLEWNKIFMHFLSHMQKLRFCQKWQFKEYVPVVPEIARVTTNHRTAIIWSPTARAVVYFTTECCLFKKERKELLKLEFCITSFPLLTNFSFVLKGLFIPIKHLRWYKLTFWWRKCLKLRHFFE